MEVKKLKQNNPGYKLDSDLVQIFGDNLDPISSKYGNNYTQLLE